MNKKVIIYVGGTTQHITRHLAISAPAYGSIAEPLVRLCIQYFPKMDVEVRATRMAGGKSIDTNHDLELDIAKVVRDPLTKIVIMAASICDFKPILAKQGNRADGILNKNQHRFSAKDGSVGLMLQPAKKLLPLIRAKRKDIFLIGFSHTHNATVREQYSKAINLCKSASANLIFANDTATNAFFTVVPEEAKYGRGNGNRLYALNHLIQIASLRSHLTFTQSTVVDGKPISWRSKLVPASLRNVINYCIKNGAYKSVVDSGITAGHFAVKLSDTEFLTSIRRTNFNDLKNTGMVKIKTDGPDTVLAYGAKPSVGGQSQRIVFKDHPDMDCIVHFHCPISVTSKVPIVSQREFECGSHECGKNTSNGLRQFGNLKAVYLDNHGPNIVFNRNINPQEVIDFIESNFDLTKKTGGL